MAEATSTVAGYAPGSIESKHHEKWLFWGCFIALIATAFGFITRMFLLNEWAHQFALNPVQIGEVGGVGIWPFAISIILFSLVIDRIGYGKAMAFAFICHVTYAVIVICAPLMLAPESAGEAAVLAGRTKGYWMLYIGSFIFALGNGTVEAVINPVVATMFSREKTKWLNILHAGWPGGLVLAGIIAIAMGDADWRYKIALIFIPVIVYGIMMASSKFPVNERVAAGGSYLGMLQEFGVLAAIVVVGLIVRQLGEVFGGQIFGADRYAQIWWKVELAVGGAIVLGYALYVRAAGRLLLFFLMLIMVPLATTEIGTDGWISSLMEPVMKGMGRHPGWVLVYTSFIMLVLRFFAGPIVHKLSPLGLLAVSAAIAAGGLYSLSLAGTGLAIFLAATLYGFGKTFFWPTMLGVVSEQCPRGGALTLNAVGGVGMLAVGVLGFPFIGLLQAKTTVSELEVQASAIAQEVVVEKHGIFGKYEAVDPDTLKTLPADQQKQIEHIQNAAQKGALATMAIFPCIMLLCYLALIAYFRARGGYKAQVLTGHAAHDEEFTGGVQGPIEA